jgi:hypothetical protein
MSTSGSLLLTRAAQAITAIANHTAGMQNIKRIAIPKRLIIHLLYLLLISNFAKSIAYPRVKVLISI